MSACLRDDDQMRTAGGAAKTRETTVLFADVRLPEGARRPDDPAELRRCLQLLAEVIQQCAGRVVKTLDSGVMALFASADLAADAAMRMHLRTQTLALDGAEPPALRIAFHSGPVIQRDDDIFGDTVNVASRLIEQTVSGQVLTSDDTTLRLSPLLQTATRRLYPVQLRGKAQPIDIRELVWRHSPDITDVAGTFARRHGRASLVIKYGERSFKMRRQADSLLIGRDAECGIVVADAKASRQHCTIERVDNRFVLQDRSTNGTYVTIADEREVVIHRTDFHLRKHGWIAFGQPRAESTDILEFICE